MAEAANRGVLGFATAETADPTSLRSVDRPSDGAGWHSLPALIRDVQGLTEEGSELDDRGSRCGWASSGSLASAQVALGSAPLFRASRRTQALTSEEFHVNGPNAAAPF